MAFATDERGAGIMAVAIVSLLHNNPALPLHIHVITDGLSDKALRPLRRIEKQYGQPIEIHRFSASDLQRHHSSAEYPVSTLFRLLISGLAPDIGRLLYLDIDCIVNGDIRQLLDTDLDGAVATVVRDQNDAFKYLNRQAGLPDDNPYFNAGVMLVDLVRWRSDDVSRRCIELLGSRRFFFNDQDVLNRILEGKVKLLDPRYNVQTRLYYPAYSSDSVKETVANAVIRHYTGMDKPWVHHPHPRWAGDKHLWLSYYRMTPRVRLPWRWTFRGVRSCMAFIRCCFNRLGIGHYPAYYDRYTDRAWHDGYEETHWAHRQP